MTEKGSKLWFFEQFDLLKEIPAEIMEKLDDGSILHQTFKKEPIYLQNDHSDNIYFCKEGRIKISKTSVDGQETTLYIVQPGEIFGELALVDSGKRTHSAEALDKKVLLCSFNKQKFQEMLDEHPTLSRQVYKKIGERLRKVEKKLSELVFLGSDERVISFLVEIGKENLKLEVDEAYIRPFFTHEEIAHLTATSRQTVTTVLNRLRAEGMLTFSRDKMYIKEFSRLKRLLK